MGISLFIFVFPSLTAFSVWNTDEEMEPTTGHDKQGVGGGSEQEVIYVLIHELALGPKQAECCGLAARCQKFHTSARAPS